MLAACLGVSLLSAASGGETIDRVLAVAGGQIITLSDVTAARDFGIAEPAAGADPIRAMVSALIDRELVLIEVDRYAPPEPPADAVDRELASVRARFGTSEAFDAALNRSGIDAAHVREALRDNLRIRAYQDQRFSPADPRRQTLIAEWIAGLRRRGDVIDLSLAAR
jgi:hypothetical protein